MRILALTGASDRPETAILAGIARAGHQVWVWGEVNQTLRSTLEGASVIYRDLPCHSRFEVGYLRAIRQFVREQKIDIIHAFTGRTLSNAALATYFLSPRPKLVGYRGTMGHVSKFDLAAWTTYLSPRVNAISCVSGAVADYLRTHNIAEEKLKVIHKGHQIEWYSANTPILRSTLGIPEDAIVVGCAANMRRIKGVDVLLQAARALTEEKIHYILVGEVRDPRVRKLLRTKELQKIVHAVGPQPEVTRYLAACDIVVIPSRGREGLPKALIEAMSCGRAVIASSVGGIPEVVRPKIDGLLVPPANKRLLAGCISLLAEDPTLRVTLGQNAVKRIQEEFSVEKSVKLTLEMYEQL